VPMGGHTVKGPEFTYGLAVTGTVHPAGVLTNAGARPGDVLVLTKPIGTGVLGTALKRGELGAAGERLLVETMATTNRQASLACREVGVHALTDVTGFGLLGHALEMAAASGVELWIEASRVPLLPGAVEAVTSGAAPGGLHANRAWVADKVRFDGVGEVLQQLLVDPQTSGGLLASVPGDRAEELLAACTARGVRAVVVGRAKAGAPGAVVR
jgi:selenide, water dikinase